MNDQLRIGSAIDVGSNSVHLLVTELGGDAPRVLRDESVLLGLGAMVDLEGSIPEHGAAAALEALIEYVEMADDEGADWVMLMGTEPLRRASNRSHFCDRVEEATGRPLHVLSHEEEALLTALAVLDGAAIEEPLLVLDIGGGSSEIVLLQPGADPVVGVMPIGSARLTAQHVEDDPPTADEVAALRAEAHHLLSGMPVGHPRRGIVVGGSGTNLVRLTRDDDDEKSDGRNTIDKERTTRAIQIVMSRPAHELVDEYGLRERRILQMAAGASLIEATLDCYNLVQLEASDASIREGALIARSFSGASWRDDLTELVTGA